ncbi:MAG TPA: hypothetical protein VL172_09855 [Kofleriaceae bacterium]|jgi:hypothetical protein|nr:hypothetical protein [Kofleriaceae bacterium]
MGEWYRLGFSFDDVVGGWQDQRLAHLCDQAWQAAGRPTGVEILQTAGEGDFAICWYLRRRLVPLLNAHGVPWQRFFAGVCAAPPPDAQVVTLAIAV